MPFDSDRIPSNDYSRGNILWPVVPSTEVAEGKFAFPVQRSNYPTGFKGQLGIVMLEGFEAFKFYIDRPYLSNNQNINVRAGDRVLISGNGNIQAWAATEGQWFTISDIGNKLKSLVPSVITDPGYTIEGKSEDLELNSLGSAWGTGEHYENMLVFVCDGNKNWRVGGQMKLSDLFPSTTTTTPTPTPTTTVDTTPPRIVLLDEPKVNITNGNLLVNIRTLLIDEATSTTGGGTSGGGTSLPTVSRVGRTPARVTTVGEEPVKIQMRIDEAVSSSTLPKISFSSRTPARVTTAGEASLKVQLRIEE